MPAGLTQVNPKEQGPVGGVTRTGFDTSKVKCFHNGASLALLCLKKDVVLPCMQMSAEHELPFVLSDPKGSCGSSVDRTGKNRASSVSACM